MKPACKIVRPVMSIDFGDAHRRVLSLYKACYREIPYILKYFDIPKNEENCRLKIRERFYEHACVTDIRIVDILMLKGSMELKEITHNWQQKSHIMANWNPTIEPKPRDFISKFLMGLD